ncbi:hypothetical protein HOLleu_36187 [Holothuria leucospilota]|uniref:Netrin receptor UNC5 n=1 Tax=Holothuria leucospilota TaxID=206669 RepID=A0A9Q0YJE6_HOLLE|nr:hypothetical protein HOLleu_36187 [Holothuria leucospilota]
MSRASSTKVSRPNEADAVITEVTAVTLPRHKRFLKGSGWELNGLSLSADGKIVVSGFHYNGKSFIDLYSTSKDKTKLIYSKEFDKYSNKPYQNVTFCDFKTGMIAACVADKLELFEIVASKLSRSSSRKLNGESRSVAVTEGKIFLGISGSNKILVFNQNFDESKSINLEGIEETEYPWDMALVKDRLFVITRVRGIGNRALSYGRESGSILTEFQNTVRRNPSAQSIAVSENSGLVVVLWNGDQIISYPFSENKPLLVFCLGYNVRRIRISEGQLVSGSIAGDVQIFDLEQLFNFNAMKRTLAHIISTEECEELQSYFGVADEVMVVTDARSENDQGKDGVTKNVKRAERLLTTFEQGGHFDPWNITNLRNALETLGDSMRVSILKGPIEGYSRHGKYHVTTIENLEAELKTKEKTWKFEKQQLNDTITTLQKEYEEVLKTTQNEQRKMEIQYYERVNSLEEKLRESEHNRLMEKTANLQTVKTFRTKQEAEFEKLIEGIAEHLTLGDALKLAKLFMLPESVRDFLCRVSLHETPGIRLLKVITQRSIINMYDATNLQKAFEILGLDIINNDFVVPYQNNVDVEQSRSHKLKEFSLDVSASCDSERESKVKYQKDSTTESSGEGASPTDESGNRTYGEVTAQSLYNRVSTSGGRHNSSHAEGIIGKEGGKIHLADVSIIVPPDAIIESQVISLDVIVEAPQSLSTEVKKTIMTPVVKLEPLGLVFKKALQLTIPHFTRVQVQEAYNVVSYSGEISDQFSNTTNNITWSEMNNVRTELHERSVTIDVQCLSYICASIVSHGTAASLHIVRVVSFIDGMRNTNEDIILTLCFCRDNDVEYNSLLLDYKTKLTLEQYSTLHLQSQTGSGDADFLNVTFSSVKNTYLSDNEQVVTKFSVAHICSASRVAHQVRLTKGHDSGNDVIDLKLVISQENQTKAECFLKARVKDLLISQESEDLLLDFQPPIFKPYEGLKMTIASMLETLHCHKLATYFGLSPAETDMVQNDEYPGRMLMKILDEREKIMPQKMSYLFHGLKYCHLDKIARIVLQYIEEHSGQTLDEKNHTPDTQTEKKAIDERNSKDISTQCSSHDLLPSPCRTNQAVQTVITATTITDTTLVKTLTEDVSNKGDEVHKFDLKENSIFQLQADSQQYGLMRYVLLMSLDGLLQINRGVLILPTQFNF